MFEKLDKIPTKIIYVLTVIILIIPLFVPWNLPIGATAEPKMMFDTINALEGTGKSVLFIYSTAPVFWGEFKHMFFAVIQHVFLLEDVKLILVPISSATSMPLMHQTLDAISNPLNKQYGVDYVQLSFLPVMSAGITSMAMDFRNTFSSDEQGTPIDELSIMDGIDTIDDFEVVVFSEMAMYHYVIPRFMYPLHPTQNYFYLCGASGFPFVAPYVGKGNVYPAGLRGIIPAAEYQALYGGPYSGATTFTDALSGVHLFTIVLVVCGNIPLLAKKLRRGGI